MGVNEHERLSNCTLGHKVPVQSFYSIHFFRFLIYIDFFSGILVLLLKFKETTLYLRVLDSNLLGVCSIYS